LIEGTKNAEQGNMDWWRAYPVRSSTVKGGKEEGWSGVIQHSEHCHFFEAISRLAGRRDQRLRLFYNVFFLGSLTEIFSKRCEVLPVIEFLDFSPFTQHFNRKSARYNYY